MSEGSRLIVKNLPKHLKEEDLARHFASKGAIVTDAKIMVKNGRSRQFGFVGFKSDQMALEAKKYFHLTYLHTSKIEVDTAKRQGDDTLERPWSRHSLGSSAHTRQIQQKGGKPQNKFEGRLGAAAG